MSAFTIKLEITPIGGIAQNVTGQILASAPIRITAREGEARLAFFTLNPQASGEIDPYSWVGAAVELDYVQIAEPDDILTRLFTGIVHLPSYDINTGLMAFTCTDNLQEVVELIDRGAIDILIPSGYWHESIFNDPDENWTYAQQRLSTYPGSMDLSPAGATRITAWARKTTPDAIFTDADILDRSLSVTLAERRNITNSIGIIFVSRFERLWQRELTAAWDYPSATWYDYLVNMFELPTQDNVMRAATGWILKAVSFDPLPDSGFYGPSGSEIAWIKSDFADVQCLGFNMSIATRWKQTVNCEYEIIVKAQASIDAIGELKVSRQHALSAEPDQTFTQFESYQTPLGTEIETGNFVATNESSDLEAAFLTALNQAKTTILQAHRANRVKFSSLIRPDLDIDKTIEIDHTFLECKAKVSMLEHIIDLQRGSATSQFELAVYLPDVAGQIDDALTLPASNYANPASLPNSIGTLNTYVGNVSGADPEDDEWRGWICNAYNWIGIPPGPEVYETKLTIEIPEIVENDPVTFTGSPIIFDIALPRDGLKIYK